MTSGDGMTLEWDVLDRLLSVETANNFSRYGYDYTGRRITKRVYVEKPTTSQTQPQSTTIYVDSTYEIRDGQPIKYVHHNGKRIARIIRRLSSSNEFVQRIPLQPGWNVVALAVEGTDLSLPTGIENLYLLDMQAGTFTQLTDTGSGYQIPAGSVFWVEVSQHLTWSIKGAPINGPSLAAQDFEPGSHWIANLGTQGIPLNQFPTSVNLQLYDATAQVWRHRLTGELAEATGSHTLPQIMVEEILPGEVALGVFDTSFTLEPADPDLEIRYYHTDHLGSSSVMTTASGELAYEHYYLPYGSTRFEFTPKDITEPYGYIGKEQDLSTGLHYVEARYLLSGLGTFISVDPLENGLGGQWIPYGYTGGNPWSSIDSTGLQVIILPEDGFYASRRINDDIFEKHKYLFNYNQIEVMYRGADPKEVEHESSIVYQKFSAFDYPTIYVNASNVGEDGKGLVSFRPVGASNFDAWLSLGAPVLGLDSVHGVTTFGPLSSQGIYQRAITNTGHGLNAIRIWGGYSYELGGQGNLPKNERWNVKVSWTMAQETGNNLGGIIPVIGAEDRINLTASDMWSKYIKDSTVSSLQNAGATDIRIISETKFYQNRNERKSMEKSTNSFLQYFPEPEIQNEIED